ncbi:MAG: hypothetical protein RLZZ501_1579 [Pseudomonadota bacterium]
MAAMFAWIARLFGAPPAAKATARSRPAAPAARTTPPRPAAAVTAAAERARLLREASEIHRAKRKILDALSDEDRAKLVSMAILAFLDQKDQPPPPPPPRPLPPHSAGPAPASPPPPSPRRK